MVVFAQPVKLATTLPKTLSSLIITSKKLRGHSLKKAATPFGGTLSGLLNFGYVDCFWPFHIIYHIKLDLVTLMQGLEAFA